jgi:hypothetical protein
MAMDYHAIVIAKGFGANVVASNLAARFPNTTGKPKVLMHERGCGGSVRNGRSHRRLQPSTTHEVPAGGSRTDPVH